MRRLRFPQLPNHQPAPWDSPRIFQAYISKEERREYSAIPHTSPNRHLPPPPWRQRTNERHHHQGRQRRRKRGGRGGDLSGKWIDDDVLLDSSSPCMSEPPSPPFLGIRKEALNPFFDRPDSSIRRSGGREEGPLLHSSVS